MEQRAELARARQILSHGARSVAVSAESARTATRDVASRAKSERAGAMDTAP